MLLYNGLQTKLEHHTGHGLYLLNSFTWSHAIDNAEGHLEEVAGDSGRINLANPRGDRGISGYNQPLNDSLSIVYDIPYGKGRMFGGNASPVMQEFLGGWQLTAINSANSGGPINITYTPNSAQSISTIDVQRPNQISKNVVIPKRQRQRVGGNQDSIALNLSAFSIPDNNHPYGTAGRNSVRFDPFYQLDLGLHKNFILHEGVSFDFRTEAFNVLNQTNYAVPQSNVSSSSSFGVVAAASTFPARILQFAGKIIF